MTLACLRLSSIIVILCVLPASSYKLPEYEVYYKDGQTLKCLTRNDKDPCLPDTQIEACNRSGDKVQCVKCKPGLRLCDSSTSALPTKCYDPKDFCSGDGDNVVKVTDLPGGGCTISCVCNEDHGYTGSDPNQCDYNNTPCSVYTSRQFSPHIYCMPCPNGYFNPRDDGIDMCIPQTTGSTSESETSSIPQTTTRAPVQKVTESSTAVQTSSTTALPQEENHNETDRHKEWHHCGMCGYQLSWSWLPSWLLSHCTSGVLKTKMSSSSRLVESVIPVFVFVETVIQMLRFMPRKPHTTKHLPLARYWKMMNKDLQEPQRQLITQLQIRLKQNQLPLMDRLELMGSRTEGGQVNMTSSQVNIIIISRVNMMNGQVNTMSEWVDTMSSMRTCQLKEQDVNTNKRLIYPNKPNNKGTTDRRYRVVLVLEMHKQDIDRMNC